MACQRIIKAGFRLFIVFSAFVVIWLVLDQVLAPPGPGDIDYSVQVVDRNNKLLRLYTTDAGYWRLHADVDDIDPQFIAQLLAYEDKRFLSHYGVDPLAIFRAGYQYLVFGQVVSGASTITMQTVRLLKPRPRNLWSKVVEMSEAFRLERRYGKKEILDLYLSIAPYGGNLQGIEAASLFYFNKKPVRLNPSESALLICLPQSPESRRPDRHPRRAAKGRLSVLKRLVAADLLSEEDLVLADTRVVPTKRSVPFLIPHLSDELRGAQPDKKIFLTTIDKSLQLKIDAIAAHAQQQLEDGATMAVLVVDNSNQQVVAHIGSGSFFAVSQLDLTRAVRSPGSALKPFIYGLGFEQGFIHPETMVNDRPQRFGDYAPQNFDGSYSGWVSVRQALHKSLNIPAVQVLDKVGPYRLTSRFEQMGVVLQYSGEPGLPIALGGAGCTLENMAGLYSALANSGEYRPLQYLRDKEAQPAKILLPPVSAWYLDDILHTMPFPRNLIGNKKIRFKTGTSYGFRDAWAIGYDPDYTIAVWVGRPDGGYGKSGTGSTLAVPLMLKSFAALPQNHIPEKKKSLPRGVLAVKHNSLPLSLQWLRGKQVSGSQLQPITQPRIIFPVDGSVMQVKKDESGRIRLSLKADGGVPPLYWLVNGQPLTDNYGGMRASYYVQGAGRTLITLIDSVGKRDRVAVWLEP